MRTLKELTSLETVDTFITEHSLSFIYISKTNCSVCHSLLPQVREVMNDFPLIQMGHLNADYVEEIAGHFSIFTAPVLILFVDGKEFLREARFIHLEQLREKIKRIYDGYTIENEK
ncbi:thioredoxin family protein [Bacillus sp. DX1.1]|uniref:thioredoxin family protein n=1 Tax=unclassified Bacillus (in: firmicutes) TaxID=185979 RepID=UPI002570DEAB|nr:MULTISPECIES: thioredoxin family protein [unclassified Bacillus (in: firmicutes)]MDM5154443.1 thioredoxin family protein [Bacillus sp. DX1.1]WJE83347.1 thioredoxin family protein [Bacillus sp. DX3.1]